MWDLVTEYLTSLLESDFFAWSFVALWCVGSWCFITWRCEDDPHEEHEDSDYVDPASPRVAPRSDADVSSVVAAAGPARGPYRVSRRAVELGVSPSGLDQDSCFSTTGLSRPRGDAA